MSSLRRKWISDPAFKVFKKVLPPLSSTEKEAMEAGSVWWDAELFSGKPNFTTLHHYPAPTLTAEEQAFMDNELETLLDMLDDQKIVKEDRDLP
ncbi:acyl-CoA dehydrogenase, partial [Vibrio parahaemolyticus]|nr:acyl-CoA dehydrogenase [Vibrio parahaemolyticus]